MEEGFKLGDIPCPSGTLAVVDGARQQGEAGGSGDFEDGLRHDHPESVRHIVPVPHCHSATAAVREDPGGPPGAPWTPKCFGLRVVVVCPGGRGHAKTSYVCLPWRAHAFSGGPYG